MGESILQPLGERFGSIRGQTVFIMAQQMQKTTQVFLRCWACANDYYLKKLQQRSILRQVTWRLWKRIAIVRRIKHRGVKRNGLVRNLPSLVEGRRKKGRRIRQTLMGADCRGWHNFIVWTRKWKSSRTKKIINYFVNFLNYSYYFCVWTFSLR